jgi:hypothetical protein
MTCGKSVLSIVLNCSGENMMSETVSIIIPAYNAAQYIDDALRSAMAQSYPAIEMVVVDDGSTDETAARVRAIQDSRIRYLYQSNAGQSAAINVGVEASNGKYIKILDADDWLSPEHVQAQMDALQGHPDSVASCRWGYFVNDYTNPDVRSEHSSRSYDRTMDWLIDSFTRDEGMMGGWMWLIPRTVWERAGGYDERLSLNNDFHFSIALLLAANGVQFAERAIYSYRKTGSGALSGSSGRKAMESALLTTQLGTDMLLQRDSSANVRRICANRFQQWLFQFYPAFPDLAETASGRINELGGSDLQLQGGRILRMLLPVIGWKRVRQIQNWVYSRGWQHALRRKQAKRLAALK